MIASVISVPTECSRNGFRHANGSDEPEPRGQPRLLALSTIHLASSKEYDKCLSLKIGTETPAPSSRRSHDDQNNRR